jgi:hypothetical protein
MATTGCPECALASPALDRLVVARIHNVKHSPIGRLPDELLLIVFQHFRDDILAPFCVRRVSSRFRRLLGDRATGLGWEDCDFAEDGLLRLRYAFLAAFHLEKYKELLDRLWRDVLCAKCSPHCRLKNSPLVQAVCRCCAGTRRFFFGCDCLPFSARIPQSPTATQRRAVYPGLHNLIYSAGQGGEIEWAGDRDGGEEEGNSSH